MRPPIITRKSAVTKRGSVTSTHMRRLLVVVTTLPSSRAASSSPGEERDFDLVYGTAHEGMDTASQMHSSSLVPNQHDPTVQQRKKRDNQVTSGRALREPFPVCAVTLAFGTAVVCWFVFS